MGILDSSIGRLMLVVLTAALGMVTLQTQSEFWLGVLAAVSGIWMLQAASVLTRSPGRPGRTFCAVFLVFMSLSLTFGFSPWSDRSVRVSYPTDSKGWAPYWARTLPTTKAFLLLSRYVRPWHCTELRTYDQAGAVVTRLRLTVRPDRAGDHDQLYPLVEETVRSDVAFFSTFQPGHAIRLSVANDSVRVYLDACYLLASLLTSAPAGVAIATLIGGIRASLPQAIR
jgi:hypothetical protein